MKDKLVIDAEDAYKKTAEILNTRLKEVMSLVHKKIEQSILCGLYCTRVLLSELKNMEDEVETELGFSGYCVERQCERDGESYLLICWSNSD